MKKNKNCYEGTFSQVLKEITDEVNYYMNDKFLDLLLLENKVLYKKINKEKLTTQERIFDLLLPPSFSIRFLRNIKKSGRL